MTWLSDFEGIRPQEQAETPDLERLAAFELSSGECDYLRQVEGLGEARWGELPVAERLSALRELEARLADIEGRPVMDVEVETLAGSQNGYYDRARDIICISANLLSSPEPFEAIDTVAHEGRHAYQHYVVEHDNLHDDSTEVEAWRANFADYLPASMFGYEEYRNQPVEADAWRYGEMIRAVFERLRG